MDSDLMMVVGIVLVVLAFPSFLAAFSESRFPRSALMLVLIGGGMIAYALVNTPGGYQFRELPNLFVRVIGSYIR